MNTQPRTFITQTYSYTTKYARNMQAVLCYGINVNFSCIHTICLFMFLMLCLWHSGVILGDMVDSDITKI